jgi:hypothetical protein
MWLDVEGAAIGLKQHTVGKVIRQASLRCAAVANCHYLFGT